VQKARIRLDPRGPWTVCRVTVRLLTHHCTSSANTNKELLVKEATRVSRAGASALRSTHGHGRGQNHRLGTRGVRPGISSPAPVRHAGAARWRRPAERESGRRAPIVEIRSPDGLQRGVLALPVPGSPRRSPRWSARRPTPGSSRVRRGRGCRQGPGGAGWKYSIGTMIETPRARDAGGRDRRGGTNSLFGPKTGPDGRRLSRDDVEGLMMSAYIEKGLLQHNPFETVDAGGDGRDGGPGCSGRRRPEPPQGGACAVSTAATGLDRPLRPGGDRLRQRLALPGDHRPPGRRPGSMAVRREVLKAAGQGCAT